MKLVDLFKTVNLHEQSRAFLYHAIKFQHAVNALQKDILDAHSIQRYWPNGKRHVEKDPEYQSSFWLKGLSLTRDLNFAKSWKEIVFVLDQEALAKNYKIIPYSWNYHMTGNYGNMKFNHKKEREEFLITGKIEKTYGTKSDSDMSWEEFSGPKGNLAPLSKYLVGFYIDKGIYDLYNGKGFEELIKHPKFMGFFPGREMRKNEAVEANPKDKGAKPGDISVDTGDNHVIQRTRSTDSLPPANLKTNPEDGSRDLNAPEAGYPSYMFTDGDRLATVGEGITEAKILDNYGSKLYKNPTKSDIVSLLKQMDLRGLVSKPTGNVYVWNAYDGIHFQVENDFYNEEPFIRFYLYDDTTQLPHSAGVAAPEWDPFYKTNVMIEYYQNGNMFLSYRSDWGDPTFSKIIKSWGFKKPVMAEAQTVEVNNYSGTVKVWKNPTRTDIRAIMLNPKISGLRGLVTPDGNVYVWPASDLIHDDVSNAVGFPIEDGKYEYTPTKRIWGSFHIHYRNNNPTDEWDVFGQFNDLASVSLGNNLELTYPKIDETIFKNKITSSWGLKVPVTIGEAQIETIAIETGMAVKLWKNPTKIEIKTLLNNFDLRGLLLDNNVYVWEASLAIHDAVADNLDPKHDHEAISFFLYSDTREMHNDEWNPNIYGNKNLGHSLIDYYDMSYDKRNAQELLSNKVIANWVKKAPPIPKVNEDVAIKSETKYWILPRTNQVIPVEGITHDNFARIHSDYLYSHNKEMGLSTDSQETKHRVMDAYIAGWVRVGIMHTDNGGIVYATGYSNELCIKALRTLRKLDHSFWSEMGISDVHNNSKLMYGDDIDKILKYGRLSEAKTLKLEKEKNGKILGNLVVYKNPTRSEVIALAAKSELRGLVLGNDTVVWEAYNSTHLEIAYMLSRSPYEFNGINTNDIDIYNIYNLSYFIHNTSRELPADWNSEELAGTRWWNIPRLQIDPNTILLMRGENLDISRKASEVPNNRVVKSWLRTPSPNKPKKTLTTVESKSMKIKESNTIKIANTTVYKNPTRSEIIKLAEKSNLRGIADSKNVYVWNAYDAIHYNVIKKLEIRNIKEILSFIVYNPETMNIEPEWDQPYTSFFKINNETIFVQGKYEKLDYIKTNRVLLNWKITQEFDESKSERIPSRPGSIFEVEVFINPTSQEIIKRANSNDYRGLYWNDGAKETLIIWVAYDIVHDQMAMMLRENGYNVPYKVELIYLTRSKEEALDWRTDEAIATIYQVNNIYICSDNDLKKYPFFKTFLGKGHHIKESKSERIFNSFLQKTRTDEAKLLKTSTDIIVYENPTFNEVKSLVATRDIRGILSHEGDILIWDAMYAIHDDIISELSDISFDPRTKFELSSHKDKDTFWYNAELKFSSFTLFTQNDGLRIIENNRFIRSWKKQNNPAVVETKIIKFNDTTVYENPTLNEITTLATKFDMRGIIDTKGTVYVWNSYLATHDDISANLHTKITSKFEITQNLESTEFYSQSIQLNDSLFLLYQNDNFLLNKIIKSWIKSTDSHTGTLHNNKNNIKKIVSEELIKIDEPFTTTRPEWFKPFNVYKNPSFRQVQSLAEIGLRGLLDDQGNVYVWDAYKAIHSQVAEALGLKIDRNDQFEITTRFINHPVGYEIPLYWFSGFTILCRKDQEQRFSSNKIIQAWINDPLNDDQQLTEENIKESVIKTKLGPVHLLVDKKVGHGYWHLEEIERDDKSQPGAGAIALNSLCKQADKENITIILYPSFPRPKELGKYYEKFGFKWETKKQFNIRQNLTGLISILDPGGMIRKPSRPVVSETDSHTSTLPNTNKLVKEITEAKTFKDKGIQFIQNPTFSDLAKLVTKSDWRGISTEDGNVYLWPAFDAVHLEGWAIIANNIYGNWDGYWPKSNVGLYIHDEGSTDVSPTWAEDPFAGQLEFKRGSVIMKLSKRRFNDAPPNKVMLSWKMTPVEINEAQIIKTESSPIYKNPTWNQLKSIISKEGDLRGITINNDLYLSSAYYMTHDHIADNFGVNEYNPKTELYYIHDKNSGETGGYVQWEEHPTIIDKDNIHIIADRSPIKNRIVKSWIKSSTNESVEFVGTKVVDNSGQPLVVYHGTYTVFDKFNVKRWNGVGGIYFTPDLKIAQEYAIMSSETDGDDPRIISAHLNIKNPKIMLNTGLFDLKEKTIAALERQGYDGVFGIDNTGKIFEYIAFHPDQIKILDNFKITDKMTPANTTVAEDHGNALPRIVDYPSRYCSTALIKNNSQLMNENTTSVYRIIWGSGNQKGLGGVRIEAASKKEAIKIFKRDYVATNALGWPNMKIEGVYKIDPISGEEILDERTDAIRGDKGIIFKNPTWNQLKALCARQGDLRAVADTNDIYVANAYKMTHDDIAHAIGNDFLTMNDQLYYIHTTLTKPLKNNNYWEWQDITPLIDSDGIQVIGGITAQQNNYNNRILKSWMGRVSKSSSTNENIITNEERLSIAGHTFTIYKNLGYEGLRRLWEEISHRVRKGSWRDEDSVIRGLIVGDDVYWWDAWYGTHYEVGYQLGLLDGGKGLLAQEVWLNPVKGCSGCLYLAGYHTIGLDTVAIQRIVKSSGGEGLYVYDPVVGGLRSARDIGR